MAIDFTAAGQYLNFGNTTAYDDLTSKTVTAWVYPDTFAYNAIVVKWKSQAPLTYGVGWYLICGDSEGTPFVTFVQTYASGASGTAGVWRAYGDIATGSWQFVSASYTVGTANTPKIYLNGQEITIDDTTTPAGTVHADNTIALSIGGEQDIVGKFPFDGKIQDVRIYNRILPADEIYALYTSRRISFLRCGLVFHIPLIGASGLTKFDGATLGATNYLKDIVGGTQGTVVGSPVGAGNVIQRVY